MRTTTHESWPFWPPEEPVYDVAFMESPYGLQRWVRNASKERVKEVIDCIIANGSALAISFYVREVREGFPVVLRGQAE